MVRLQGEYRLEKATVAIDCGGLDTKCFQVPEAATVRINGFHREGPLVEVFYDGRPLLMFWNDLAERAQPIQETRPPYQRPASLGLKARRTA